MPPPAPRGSTADRDDLVGERDGRVEIQALERPLVSV
jgi:hypothetical protein